MPYRLLPAIFLVLLAGACASSGPSAIDRLGSDRQRSAATLCEFRQRPRPSVMLHIDKTSQIYLGEIDVEAYKQEFEEVASAVAMPVVAMYRREYRADCRNEATGAWYPCTKTVDIDLSKVEVIVRGLDLERVSEHAVEMCDKHTLTLIPAEGDIRRLSAKFRCELVRRRMCPLE